MEQNNKKLSKCVIDLERKKEIGDFVKVIDVIDTEPDYTFEDKLREKLLADRIAFSDLEKVRDIHLGGRSEYINHKQAREKKILNNGALLVEKFAKSDGSDLKQFIEEKKAFNQQYGIEM